MKAKTFGERLKQAREESGYTQEQVADNLNIGRSTLANYEVNRTEPNLENLAKLADFYYVSADWLIGTKGANKKE